MESSKRELATIQNLDKPGDPPIKCLFNPKEYSIQKQNQWSEESSPAQNVPKFQFNGGKASTLTMQLFFDTYATQEDVRTSYVTPICNLMLIDGDSKDRKSNKGRPPKVLFQWGKGWSFEAVITSIKQTYTLFLPTGVPVRATLDVTFQEVKDLADLPAQNPTSGGLGGERMYRVASGDTLALIAYRQLGNSSKWRQIAEANQLKQVRDLTPGMMLVIPND
jgi:nucleoid-associated protein YgaU